MIKILLASLLLTPLVIQAETLFYCKTVKGKQVRIQQNGNSITYTFGQDLDKPELSLKKARNTIDMIQTGFSGGGETLFTIPNKGYHYEVFAGIYKINWQDNGQKTHEERGGVRVFKGEKLLAEMACDPNTIQLK